VTASKTGGSSRRLLDPPGALELALRQLQATDGWLVSYYVAVIVPIAPPTRIKLDGLAFDAVAFAASLAASLSNLTSEVQVASTFEFGSFESPPPEDSAEAFIDEVEYAQLLSVAGLAELNRTRVVATYNGQAVVAQRAINEDGEEVLVVELPNSLVQVELPLGLVLHFAGEEPAAVVISDIDVDQFMERNLSRNGLADGDDILAIASVEIAIIQTGIFLEVDGLDELPWGRIRLRFFNISAEAARCEYWDQNEYAWSESGVSLASYENGVLVCETNHLSFFAAVGNAFLDAFLCSQASLLTADGFNELNSEGWYYEGPCIALWLLLVALGGVLVSAVVMERQRFGGKGGWQDHYFLVAKGSPPLGVDILEGPEGTGGKIAFYAWLCGMWETTSEAAHSAFSDMIDEFLGAMCDHLEEARHTFESVWEAVAPAFEDHTGVAFRGSAVALLCAHAAKATYRRCLATHASTALGLAVEDVWSEAQEAVSGMLHDIEDFLEHSHHNALAMLMGGSQSTAVGQKEDTSPPAADPASNGADLDPTQAEADPASSAPNPLPASSKEAESVSNEPNPGFGSNEPEPDPTSTNEFASSVYQSAQPPQGAAMGSESTRQRRSRQASRANRPSVGSANSVGSAGSVGSDGKKRKRRKLLQGTAWIGQEIETHYQSQKSSLSDTAGRNLTEWELRRAAILEKLQELHDTKVNDSSYQFTSWRAVPAFVTRVFFCGGAIGSVYSFSIYSSSAVRAMQLICDILGGAAVSTLFMSATGNQPSKKNKAGCASSDIAALIGHLIATGLTSGILAALPVGLIARFHQREFVQMDYEGCPAWNKQLRKWFIRDVIFWVLSFMYAGFCVLYIMLFFANVAAQDQGAWMISTGISLADDIVLGPFLMAFVPPFFMMLLLSVLAWYHRMSMLEVVQMWEAEEEEAKRLAEAEAQEEGKEEDGEDNANGGGVAGEDAPSEVGGLPLPNQEVLQASRGMTLEENGLGATNVVIALNSDYGDATPSERTLDTLDEGEFDLVVDMRRDALIIPV